MKVNNKFKALFALSLLIIIMGASLKLMHWGHATPFLFLGIVFTLSYSILGILEVQGSSKIDSREKLLWTLGFVFFGFITAILYLASGRKRIL